MKMENINKLENEKIATLNVETSKAEWQKSAYQEFGHDAEMYRIELEDKNGEESELLVSEKHEVYVSEKGKNKENQNSPLNIPLSKSSVVYTLTTSVTDCSWKCGSLDQIAALIESANARKSISSGSDIKSAELSRKSSYSANLKKSIDSSTSACLILNSCSDNFDLNKHSSLCLSNSDFINSGAKNLALIDENRYAETDFGFIIENKTLLSNTNFIFYTLKNSLSLGESFFNNFSLVLGETSDNNSLNLPFLAFLPNSTDHLINSCSSLDSSFFNISSCFIFLRNASLATADQFISSNSFNFSFNSSGMDKVMFSILNNTCLQVYYVDTLFKSFGYGNLNDFKLTKISDIYDNLQENEDKQLVFLDERSREIKVKNISKGRYNGRIYDADVPNNIILVRRNGKKGIWAGNSGSHDVFDLKINNGKNSKKDANLNENGKYQ